MNAIATIDVPNKPRRGRPPKNAAAPIAPAPSPPPAPVARIVPSSPVPVALKHLQRAPENVRHTRIDEDVEGLADDIAAHGLLQGLIGYRDGDAIVRIVGGGRRLQALQHLWFEEIIAGDFPVPVLIRDVDDAIELSLAENLQQRTMSPVDEFLAFKTLMERGDTSPGELAKRFGFSERVVKQRLRLAELEPSILDALAERTITIDSAMAYATSQDQALQLEVFMEEARRGKTYREAHKPADIKYTMARKGIKTDDPLYRFVGAESYERRGGGYEDDLFVEVGKERSLSNPALLQSAAREMIEFQMARLLPELQQRADLAPTITGYLLAGDLRVKSWGNIAPKPPAGFVLVEKYDAAPMWRTIRNNGIDARVLVGINDKGELTLWSRMAFVPKEQKAAIVPPDSGTGYRQETPEEREARFRAAGIDRWSRRLAVGPFAGTPFEGRAFWPNYEEDRRDTLDGQPGWLVKVNIFVSDVAVAEQRDAAEIEYQRDRDARAAAECEEAEKEAAEKARYDQLLELDPPAIVVVDGLPWRRGDDGRYAADDDEGGAPNWLALVGDHRWALDDIGGIYATVEDFDDAMAAAIAADAGEEVPA